MAAMQRRVNGQAVSSRTVPSARPHPPGRDQWPLTDTAVIAGLKVGGILC